MPRVNHRFTLAARPVGLPKPTDFTYETQQVRDPEDGEMVVDVRYISLDPAMRGWMSEVPSYSPPIAIGELIRAIAIGKVAASRNPRFAVGDHVSGMFGVQEVTLSNGEGVTPVDPSVAALPVHLGTLGMPGLTAYFGLLDIGRPSPGNTVVVSGAAGAVGSVVGQIAKLKGCRVIGIAGGADKCAYLVRELGFTAAIDYKTADLKAELRTHCPKGIDIYFDNVGGEILDTVLTRLARGARIIICGAISQYNNTAPPKGPSNYLALVVSRASMTGMLVSDYLARAPDAIRDMAGWISAGMLHTREDTIKGIETFPATFNKLFSGENHGKLVLEV